MNKEKIVKNDYLQSNKKNFFHIKFLDKYSKSKVYVSKSGLVCHQPNINSSASLKVWSDKIFSRKIDTSKRKYSSFNPIMMSRHYYSALFFKKYLKKNLSFCDFGTGEGNFLIELYRIRKDLKISFVEDSKQNFDFTKKKFYLKYKKKIEGFNGSIENADFKNKKFDASSLIWTLCNCVDPIRVLKNIHKCLNKNGLLLIAESSRIMVPFKKPIGNFFNKKFDTKNTHPWFFSYYSLSNLLEISGFRIIETNRYFDENDLIVIAQKKNLKNHKPKITFENQKKIIKFLKMWGINSDHVTFKKF